MPQHRTPPPEVTAQVWFPPAPMALMPAGSPGTAAGMPVYIVVVGFCPSWPALLSPQHRTAPPTSAQVWLSPAAIAVTPEESPTAPTGTWLEPFIVVPFPSWPTLLLPQHWTPPAEVSAHAW